MAIQLVQIERWKKIGTPQKSQFYGNNQGEKLSFKSTLVDSALFVNTSIIMNTTALGHTKEVSKLEDE